MEISAKVSPPLRANAPRTLLKESDHVQLKATILAELQFYVDRPFLRDLVRERLLPLLHEFCGYPMHSSIYSDASTPEEDFRFWVFRCLGGIGSQESAPFIDRYVDSHDWPLSTLAEAADAYWDITYSAKYVGILRDAHRQGVAGNTEHALREIEELLEHEREEQGRKGREEQERQALEEQERRERLKTLATDFARLADHRAREEADRSTGKAAKRRGQSEARADFRAAVQEPLRLIRERLTARSFSAADEPQLILGSPPLGPFHLAHRGRGVMGPKQPLEVGVITQWVFNTEAVKSFSAFLYEAVRRLNKTSPIVKGWGVLTYSLAVVVTRNVEAAERNQVMSTKVPVHGMHLELYVVLDVSTGESFFPTWGGTVGELMSFIR